MVKITAGSTTINILLIRSPTQGIELVAEETNTKNKNLTFYMFLVVYFWKTIQVTSLLYLFFVDR